MPYLFLDGDASILTAASSIVSGAHRPIVEIGSVLSAVPVSFGAGTAVLGSVAALQGTNPWVIGNSSVQLLNSPNVIGSITALQGTSPWLISSVYGNISGSIAGTYTEPNVATSVTGLAMMFKTNISTSTMGVISATNPLPTIGSVSGSVGIVGNPSISGTVNIAGNPSISGTVNIGTIPGSVVAFQGGTWTPSAIGYLLRNDAVASTLGADLTYGPGARDSAGRTLSKPFAAEESRIEGYVTLTSTSLTTLVAAAGAGLRNYITDLWFANTGATTTLVTFTDSAASVLGYTIAPTVSGSNLPGLITPIRTGVNASFNIQAGSNTSILYATVKGFKAP